MKRILTLTVNPSIDKSTTVKQVVEDKKLRCETPYHEPGGGGINVSRAIKILGGKSLALYTKGGPYGRMLSDLLDKENLKHQPFSISGLSRENLIVFEKVSNRQYRFGMPGPKLQKLEWESLLKFIKNISPNPGYIVASGSLPPGVPKDFYARLAEISKEINSNLIVDTYGEALISAAEKGVYLLKPNMKELQDLVSKKIENEFQQEKAAKEIVEKQKSKIVVVSLGAAGALLVTKNKSKRIRSPIVPIKSRVGAGDSMVAGITLSLATGKTLEESVRFGVAAGAAAAMTPRTELCRKKDTERLYKKLISEA